MPAPGRCRCRCRPRSAAATPISTSSRVQLKSADPTLLLYPARARRDGRRRGRGGRRRGRSTGKRSPRAGAPSARCPRRSRTTSPICNIRAARPASRTASWSPTARCSTISPPTPIGMKIGDGDRGVSWLPFYHDMGLVGCMLSPIANQMSVDYLKTEDFARRPLAWLDLISRNQGTTMSYSPTFGYDICARRVSSQIERRRALRPVALAGRRQRRRHDPARRHAGLRRRLRAGRLQGAELPAELRPRRGDAGGDGDAAGRGDRRRAGRGDPARRRRRRASATGRSATARSSIAASRCATWRSRSAATTAARSREREIGKVCCRGTVGDGRLFPRRGSDRAPASTPTAGSTPATWAICPTAISTSSAAPRT